MYVRFACFASVLAGARRQVRAPRARFVSVACCVGVIAIAGNAIRSGVASTHNGAPGAGFIGIARGLLEEVTAGGGVAYLLAGYRSLVPADRAARVRALVGIGIIGGAGFARVGLHVHSAWRCRDTRSVRGLTQPLGSIGHIVASDGLRAPQT